MGMNSKWVHSHLVYHDSVNGQRWLEVLGTDVVRFIENFVRWAVDDTTGDPIEYAITVVEVGAGTSTCVLADAAGGNMLMTCAANEDDGPQIQLKGESFKLDGQYPCYFGVRFKVNDADQVDFAAGLIITDTSVLGGVSDGVYFQTVDEAATLTIEVEKDSTASSGSIHTLLDDTFVVAEFYFDGTYVDSYIDGVLQTRLAVTNLPDDEELTVSLALLTGEAVANTATIDWVRAFQIRA